MNKFTMLRSHARRNANRYPKRTFGGPKKMRSLGIALFSGVVVLSACGGGESHSAQGADTAASAPAAAAPASGTVAPAPITGTIHEVKMLGDAQGYRYEPATITVKPGDGIRFVMVSGGPHNVAFDPATIPADVKDQLFANMPNSMDGSSPMLINPNETWELSLGNIKPGRYPFHCTPHLAMNMKGEIIVQ
ncbi:MAG TPA: plastocyanin/azurin family copper-binding protein [Gemmatimonadaceae bacterium]|nr:plastocyanin/azurin family copper-binding protein [Gemmatimonadaceae bacterium]